FSTRCRLSSAGWGKQATREWQYPASGKANAVPALQRKV
ncbi:MAG: hypothetical protein ACI9NT_001970, partial [Bacteroidia bacterium]